MTPPASPAAHPPDPPLKREGSVRAGARYSAAKAGEGRASQGAGQVLLGKGGLGYIARRGVDFGTSVAVQTLEGVARMAAQQPLELLSLLPDLVPEVGLALWNGTFLGCGQDSLRIKAMTVCAGGGSEEAPEGTAAIKALWDRQPDEVGGLADALAQNFQMLMFSGLCAAEAVPDRRRRGIAAVYPVNSLTLRFKRENDGTLALYQRQTANPNGLGIYSAGFGGLFEPMPMERFFYSKLPALPDEPYGRAPYGAALTVILECLAFMRDFLLAFHRVGTPKWDVSVDFEMWYTLAKEVVGLTDPKEIDDWVQAKYRESVAFFNDLNPDDAFFHDLKSKVNAVGSGDKWPDLVGMWGMLRLRLVQALKQVPTLMGIVEGDTETWSRVQWDIYASSLKALVSKAAYPLVRASQLHLQLLGLPYRAEAEFCELRSITRMLDAQATAQEILNEEAKVTNNWQLNNTASMAITGSAPPPEEERSRDTPVRTDPGRAPVGRVEGGLTEPAPSGQPGR